jgi:hypothetical protein
VDHRIIRIFEDPEAMGIEDGSPGTVLCQPWWSARFLEFLRLVEASVTQAGRVNKRSKRMPRVYDLSHAPPGRIPTGIPIDLFNSDFLNLLAPPNRKDLLIRGVRLPCRFVTRCCREAVPQC